jgi:hypothetical protein
MAFMFRLEGMRPPADPPTLHKAVPDWHPATRSRWEERRCAWFTVRDEDADQAPLRSEEVGTA